MTPNASRESKPPERRKRVLIIDDDEMVARSLARILSRHHDVYFEPSARAALARLVSGQPFDLVLCDVMMPDVTGLELHAQLVEIDPEMASRIVLMTGGAFNDEVERRLSRSSVPVLEKPFGMPQIMGLLDRVTRQI